MTSSSMINSPTRNLKSPLSPTKHSRKFQQSFDANQSINLADKLFRNSKGFAAVNRVRNVKDSDLAKQIWGE